MCVCVCTSIYEWVARQYRFRVRHPLHPEAESFPAENTAPITACRLLCCARICAQRSERQYYTSSIYSPHNFHDMASWRALPPPRALLATAIVFYLSGLFILHEQRKDSFGENEPESRRRLGTPTDGYCRAMGVVNLQVPRAIGKVVTQRNSIFLLMINESYSNSRSIPAVK